MPVKTVIAVIVLIVFIGAGGYFGLPFLIDKETTELRLEVRDLKEKVQKIEAFVQSEEDIRKVTQLTPDSDAQRIITTAKVEMELISDMFEKTKNLAPEENRKTIEELHGTLKKARGEIDSDMPAAINRINLLWHEMGKLLRKV